VARVSRLIGKSDSTAKRPGWQVGMATQRGWKEAKGCWRAFGPKRGNATPIGVAFRSPALVTGPQIVDVRWVFHRTYCRLSDRSSLFEGRFVGGGSCRAPAHLLGWLNVTPAAGFITGAYLVAIELPIGPSFSFNRIQELCSDGFLQYGSPVDYLIRKTIESASMLALRTVVSSASGHQNPANRRFAAPARQACALVDAVFQLKKAAHSIGIHIV